MQKRLDLNFKRHAILTSNIANSETPGFKARELNFAGELENALGESSSSLKITNTKHMDISDNSGNHIVFDNSGRVKADGNNVDIDIALGKVSRNASEYDNAVNLLNMKLRMLRMAAMGRGM